jgi:hypothetical protein
MLTVCQTHGASEAGGVEAAPNRAARTIRQDQWVASTVDLEVADLQPID